MFVAIAGLLWAGHRHTQKPLSLLIFKCYTGALGALLAYRLLARLPLLRRYLRPTRVTTEGSYALILALVFGLAAIYTGDNLMHLIAAVLLALFGVSGALSGATLGGLVVTRRLAGAYFAGVPGEVGIACRNAKRLLPSLAIGVEDVRADGAGEAFFAALPARASRVQSYALAPARRGTLVLGELRVHSRFPFGLFERDRLVALKDEVLVLPRISPLVERWARPHGLVPLASARRSTAADTGDDFAGLRDYQPGDPLQRIDWKAYARRGAPYVKELVPPDDRRMLVVPDTRLAPDGGAAGAERVETVVRIAASLLVHYARARWSVGLLLAGERARWAHRRGALRELLDRLAREHNDGRAWDGRAHADGGVLVVLVGQDRAGVAQLARRIATRRPPATLCADDERALLEVGWALHPDTGARVALGGR